MTPAEFLAEIALPTVLELKSNRLSRRHAYLACIATFHIKDHLRSHVPPGIEAAMRAQSGIFFDVVRGVCNGTKHARTDKSHPVPFVAGEDLRRPPAFWGTFQWGRSRLGDFKGGIDIATPGGHADLYVSCVNVLRAYVTLYPEHFAGFDLSEL